MSSCKKKVQNEVKGVLEAQSSGKGVILTVTTADGDGMICAGNEGDAGSHIRYHAKPLLSNNKSRERIRRRIMEMALNTKNER